MNNKVLGAGLLCSVGLAFLAGMIGVEDDNVYMLFGFFIVLFGIWGGIRLIQLD